MAGPAQTAATPNQVRTDLEPSTGGRFSSAFPLWDGTGRVLTTWAICRLEEPDPANPTDPTAVIFVPCTPERLAATNPAPVVAPPLYGVWMYDPTTQTQQPIVIGAGGRPRRRRRGRAAAPHADVDSGQAAGRRLRRRARGRGRRHHQHPQRLRSRRRGERQHRRRCGSRANAAGESPGAVPAHREGRGDSRRGHGRSRQHGVRPEHPAGHARGHRLRADRARRLRARQSAGQRGARAQRARRERPTHLRAPSELAAGGAGPRADVQRLPRARRAISRTAAARRSTRRMPVRPSTGVAFPNTVARSRPTPARRWRRRARA